MNISLQSPVRKIVFLVICLGLSTTLIGAAIREFLADHFSRKLDLASLQMAAKLEPVDARYQYQLGRYFLQTQHEPKTAAQFLRTATELNPHEASYWLELSRDYQRLGKRDQERDALQRAIAADPSTPDVAWDAANFYWALGDRDKALQEFRVVLEKDPYLPTAALESCWQIKPDVEALLREVVPGRVDAYSIFLDFLISRNEPVAAARVWTQIVQLQQPVERRYVFEYVRYLIERREISPARQAWRQAGSLSDLSGYQPSPENLVVNGSFSLQVLNAGFDWQYEKSSDVLLALDPAESHAGHRSLSLTFDSRGMEDAGIRQFIPVEPNTDYEFSAYFKSENMQGAGGPRFLLTDRFTGASYLASEELRDADLWKQVNGMFTTGPDTQILTLRIQRVPARNAIRGKLWIADIRLTPRHLDQEQAAAGVQ